MNSRSKSSGQILAIVIILLALIGGGFWWLFSNKQEMAKDGRDFGKEAIQRIVIQRDLAFFSSRLRVTERGLPASFFGDEASGRYAAAVRVAGCQRMTRSLQSILSYRRPAFSTVASG